MEKTMDYRSRDYGTGVNRLSFTSWTRPPEGDITLSEARTMAYELLEERTGVNLSTLLKDKRKRMGQRGVSKSKQDKASYLDAIKDDEKLAKCFIVIVKEMAIKYGK